MKNNLKKIVTAVIKHQRTINAAKKTATLTGNIVAGTAVTEGVNYATQTIDSKKITEMKELVKAQAPVAVKNAVDATNMVLPKEVQLISDTVQEKAPEVSRTLMEAATANKITSIGSALLSKSIITPAAIIGGTLVATIAALYAAHLREKTKHEVATTVLGECTSDIVGGNVEKRLAPVAGNKMAFVASTLAASYASEAVACAYAKTKNTLEIG